MPPGKGQLFGLVAPGYHMARVAPSGLSGEQMLFTGADMSTKLKLLGVDVASIGDALGETAGCQTYTWSDGPAQVYKKLVVSEDGQRLLGAVLVGDCADYATLLQYKLNAMALPASPQSLILPAQSGDETKALGVAALPDSAQICSCLNVSKAYIRAAVRAGATDMAALKAATGAATGCGGCAALVKQVMDYQLAEQGVAISKDICEHFP